MLDTAPAADLERHADVIAGHLAEVETWDAADEAGLDALDERIDWAGWLSGWLRPGA